VKALQAWDALADFAGVSGARLQPLRGLGAGRGEHRCPPIRFYRSHPHEQSPSSGRGLISESFLGSTM